MCKQIIPTKIYKEITKLLSDKQYIHAIPELRWTKNQKVYGYLSTMVYQNTRTLSISYKYRIYINKDECPCTLADITTDKGLKAFYELIDTICHELAHMTFHDHSINHEKLTEKYKKLVIDSYFADATIIDVIKDCKVN